ncbi:MAG TPA: fatty acid desaturase [Saprospiraceae bacterium]|nr:fatty acid desaturase [Saprospiraceae bacterium]
MKVLTAITDPQYQPRTDFSAYERFWLKYINDERDLPFIHLLTRIHLILLPWIVLMFTPLVQGWYWWLLYIPYAYVAQSYFKGRFGLMFHCMCHRPLFKKDYSWLHTYVTWVIAPIFGNTPETYFAHHIVMHHVENNMEEDASSTLHYQRDNPVHFLKYFLRFITMGFVDTFMYLFHRKRKKVYMRMTEGEVVYILFCIAMCFVNFRAAMMVLIVPVIYARFIMMLGNWTQHSFIDKSDPDGHFSSVYNCINNVYNRNCWNDGYHSIHHLNPALHYTDIPKTFLKNKENFVKHKTFIFDGIHYLHIFIYLMGKRYDKLADNLVNIDNTFSSKEEAMALLKARVQPVFPAKVLATT